MSAQTKPFSLFTEYDIFLFKSGKHCKLYNLFGSKEMEVGGQRGTYFAVYAPAARQVQVIGNFNHWSGQNHPLYVRWDQSGIWEGFIPGLSHGELYKYQIFSHYDSRIREKSDPYGFYFEMPPKTSTITWNTSYEWKDQAWMEGRKTWDAYTSPMSIYELHLGSWKKKREENRSLHYVELAEELTKYILDMGYTHVEFMPIGEHPYYPSWGYLSTGYFAPTSRFGSPQEFMSLIEALHRNGIGVILDWVSAHFPADESFLADFDGSKVYEHPNPKKGYHPDWNSLIFNYDRPEIQSFLLSSAHFWLDRYHVDGLRVDAVASMIYLDYSRKEGEWDANEYGSNENLGAISFLKALNTSCYRDHAGIVMIAEESTNFSGVTKPVDHGGLGFGFKWMMGWMNDTLRYMERDPVHRSHHHDEISFSMVYAYSESYLLPLSHDEVVHGKNAIAYKMPGDEWQRMANVRLLYAFMYFHPGHKLMFMGNDIGQTTEWNVDEELPWHLLDYEAHRGILTLVRDLNVLLKTEPALYKMNFSPDGFEWIDHSDNTNCILVFLRKCSGEMLMAICNFTPVIRTDYKIGSPGKGHWREIFNSDDKKYWGSGLHSNPSVSTVNIPKHSRDFSIRITVPPLATIVLKFAPHD